MPASKARLYEVTIKDGHGSYTRVIPAQSKNHLLNELWISPQEKVIDVKHLNHHAVEAAPGDDDDSIEFDVALNGENVRIRPTDQGHSYLEQQFPDKVKALEEFFVLQSR